MPPITLNVDWAALDLNVQKLGEDWNRPGTRDDFRLWLSGRSRGVLEDICRRNSVDVAADDTKLDLATKLIDAFALNDLFLLKASSQGLGSGMEVRKVEKGPDNPARQLEMPLQAIEVVGKTKPRVKRRRMPKRQAGTQMGLPGLDGTTPRAEPCGVNRRTSSRRGRKSVAEWEGWVREALSILNDPIALGRSPLARLTFVGQVAQNRYRRSVAARGRALRDILHTCLQAVGKEVDQEPLSDLIQYLLSGRPHRELARQLNVSEEHLSRTHKASLVRLLTEKLKIVTSDLDANRRGSQ